MFILSVCADGAPSADARADPSWRVAANSCRCTTGSGLRQKHQPPGQRRPEAIGAQLRAGQPDAFERGQRSVLTVLQKERSHGGDWGVIENLVNERQCHDHKALNDRPEERNSGCCPDEVRFDEATRFSGAGGAGSGVGLHQSGGHR